MEACTSWVCPYILVIIPRRTIDQHNLELTVWNPKVQKLKSILWTANETPILLPHKHFSNIKLQFFIHFFQLHLWTDHAKGTIKKSKLWKLHGEAHVGKHEQSSKLASHCSIDAGTVVRRSRWAASILFVSERKLVFVCVGCGDYAIRAYAEARTKGIQKALT